LGGSPSIELPHAEIENFLSRFFGVVGFDLQPDRFDNLNNALETNIILANLHGEIRAEESKAVTAMGFSHNTCSPALAARTARDIGSAPSRAKAIAAARPMLLTGAKRVRRRGGLIKLDRVHRSFQSQNRREL
jgi:hypothetical protein